MASINNLDVDPDALYCAGKNVAGLNGDANSHCSLLRGAVSESEGIVTHPRVRGAVADFASRSVLDPSTKLPKMITDLGYGTANVGAVTRDADNETGHRQKGHTDTSLNLGAKVNGSAAQRDAGYTAPPPGGGPVPGPTSGPVPGPTGGQGTGPGEEPYGEHGHIVQPVATDPYDGGDHRMETGPEGPIASDRYDDGHRMETGPESPLPRSEGHEPYGEHGHIVDPTNLSAEQQPHGQHGHYVWPLDER